MYLNNRLGLHIVWYLAEYVTCGPQQNYVMF